MKKFILLLLIAVLVHQSFSYTWESYGPENIKANKLKLLSSEFPTGIICVDSGMYYVTDFYGQDWQYFTYFNMPVTDVVECNFNSDSILVVMGNGSYSDGIYSFNMLTEEFHVIHYCIYPNFIYRFNDYSPYYVGYEDGLLISQDGLTWDEVSFFGGKNCIDIRILYNEMAVATDQPNNNVYWSEDSGDDWETINGEYKISELLLTFYGQLSGICSENSIDCGYYEFENFSMLWENKFVTEDLNTLGHDNCDSPFLGWHLQLVNMKGLPCIITPQLIT
jgi:hypothetical protein